MGINRNNFLQTIGGLQNSIPAGISQRSPLFRKAPCLITSNETIKHLWLWFWILLQQFLYHLHFCSSVSKSGIQRGLIFVTLTLFFRIKWTDSKPMFVICASYLKVKRASFEVIDLILLMLDLVTADLVQFYEPKRKVDNRIWALKHAKSPSVTKRTLTAKKVLYAIFFRRSLMQSATQKRQVCVWLLL